MVFKHGLIGLIIFTAVGFSCNKARPGWKTIDMGAYLIDMPNDFNLKKEKGIDSSPGELKSRNFQLFYDYGFYTDTLIMTRQEFLRKGFWKDNAILLFSSRNIRDNVNWVKTEVDTYRPCTQNDSTFAAGCDLMASCTYKTYKFDLPVYYPADVKETAIKIDTISNYYRRIDYPLKGYKGTIGVYMRPVNVSHELGAMYNAIVISTRGLDEKQQALALMIISTLRPKPR